MFGKDSRKTRERLERSGKRATATVLEISGGHVSVTTGNPQLAGSTVVPMKVRLRVEPDGEQPFEVERKMQFPQLGIPQQGGTLPVLYDPDDRDQVILDDSTEGGFGIATSMLRQRAESTGQPELRSVADFVEQATSGAGIDVEALQRSLREQFGGAAGAPTAFGFGTPPAAQPEQSEDPVDLLARLAELKEKGYLTDEEFATQKARILGES